MSQDWTSQLGGRTLSDVDSVLSFVKIEGLHEAMMGPSVMWAFRVEGRNLKWLGNAGKPGHFANSARDVLYD